MSAQRRVVVIQDGARLHYAVPAALHQAGLLERVYTNWYDAPGRIDRLLGRLARFISPDAAQRMRARHSPELPADKVLSNPWQALVAPRARRRFANVEEYSRWESDEFARWVESQGFGHGDAVFGFVRNIAPRLIKRARELGLFTIVDQMIAPRLIELRQERVQHERFPGWSNMPMPPERDCVADIEQETWELADHITCASEYVRTGLHAVGITNKPVSVIPYPADIHLFPPVIRSGRTGPFIVGFVGAVGLRKGAPYFFQVAQRLASPNVQFEMIGTVALSDHGKGQRGPVTLRGPIPRDDVPAALARFDAFLFPSTCEGSAQVIVEAMASGLPVVCSENSGSPETKRNAVHRLRYDDIEGYCTGLDSLIRRGVGVSADDCQLQTLASYRVALMNQLAADVAP